MKTKLTAKIDSINHHLDCPLTPRDSQGSIVDCQKTSAQELYQIVRPHPHHTHITHTRPHTHTQHEERSRELAAQVTQTGSLQRKHAELASLAQAPHLFIQINRLDHPFPEPCEVCQPAITMVTVTI